MTLWQGRFGEDPSDELLAYTVSLPFDRRLAMDDIQGSCAHVRGLGKAGILTGDEVAVLLAALDHVASELGEGKFSFEPGDEDVHTAVERRVTEIAGDAGAKLHTGRSRNDQVATDLRLYCKRELLVIADRIITLQRVLLDRAIAAGEAYLPGYTHLQRAQPVLLGHHLLAYWEMFDRDAARLRDAYPRADVLPLGAGALAGSPYPLDREYVARLLGFGSVSRNSLDAVADQIGSQASRVAAPMVVQGLLARRARIARRDLAGRVRYR